MDHHPLGRVESNRIGKLDAVQPVSELWAEERSSGVGSIHVQPQILRTAYGNQRISYPFVALFTVVVERSLTNDANLTQVIKSASSSCAQRGANLQNERTKTILLLRRHQILNVTCKRDSKANS